MKIKVTSVHVDDQDKALRFYTEVLGFAKKTDFSQGPYRWLTVASPEEPDGTELQLALNNNPAAKAYQQAIFQQGQPAIMFYTDDVKGDYERIKARGAEFTMPPTDVTGATIAMLNDTGGNLIQLSQLARRRAPQYRPGQGFLARSSSRFSSCRSDRYACPCSAGALGGRIGSFQRRTAPAAATRPVRGREEIGHERTMGVGALEPATCPS